MVMTGDKKSLITGGRPNKPRLLGSKEKWAAFQKNLPAATIPRVVGESPQKKDGILVNQFGNRSSNQANTRLTASLASLVVKLSTSKDFTKNNGIRVMSSKQPMSYRPKFHFGISAEQNCESNETVSLLNQSLVQVKGGQRIALRRDLR